MRKAIGLAAGLAVVLAVAACPPPKGANSGGGGGGSSGVNPGSCGNISTNAVGRKLQAFLNASAELDNASTALETSVHDACARMAVDLGIPGDGDTKTLCAHVKDELNANFSVSLKSETHAVTKYTPSVCETKIEFAATIVAQCEAKLEADVQVSCEGSCGGVCNGSCDGQCAGGTAGGGQCNAQCSGTCHGSCSASCNGSANVSASAECKASAEIHANVNTVCSEPKVEVVYETTTVVDDSKLQKAKLAIMHGLPTLLQVGAKAKIVLGAVGYWAQTAGSLVKSGGQLVGALGEHGLCVVGQLGAAFQAAAQVSVRIDVSIEASASISGAAGGSAQ